MSADGATEPGQSPLSAVSQIVEPSIDILKAIPHGIIELILRGASLVRVSSDSHPSLCRSTILLITKLIHYFR